MRELSYRAFSFNAHSVNWRLRKANVAYIELTFDCPLRCAYCYSRCGYRHNGRELSTAEVKKNIDILFDAGIIWLCFTGGDPLARSDFLILYKYAREKGFIVVVFTSAFNISSALLKYFKKSPPMCVEATVPAATRVLFEKISGVRGSFSAVMTNIRRLRDAGVALRIKTNIIKDNIREGSFVRGLAKEIGALHQLNYNIYARLNGDISPCKMRIPLSERDRLSYPQPLEEYAKECQPVPRVGTQWEKRKLFLCAAEQGESVRIDPYGNMSLCLLLRSPSARVREHNFERARKKLMEYYRARKFATNSPCRDCALRGLCGWCPGRAYVETGTEERPIKYYCRMNG